MAAHLSNWAPLLRFFSGGCVRKKKLGYTLHVRLPYKRKDIDRTEDATLEKYFLCCFLLKFEVGRGIVQGGSRLRGGKKRETLSFERRLKFPHLGMHLG